MRGVEEGEMMEQLTLLLFERMGILLIIAFMITRVPQFRYLLDGRMNLRKRLLFSVFFGIVSIAGTYAGVTINGDRFQSSFLIVRLSADEGMADSALIGAVVAGLLGGAWVGTGAGLISGVHACWIGGMTGIPDLFVTPLSGLISGWIARFFAEERVIAPIKALFISVFPPILLMGAILIVHESSESSIRLINLIGIPMVIANSIGVGIFVTMILAVLREEERAAALETQKALYIAESVLPYLKQGLSYETAEAMAGLMLRELKADAVAVTDTEHILAYAGVGTKRHVAGERIKSEISRRALLAKEIQITKEKEQIQPHHASIGAAVIIPFCSGGEAAGLIKLYYQSPRQIRPVEEALAKGLSKLISIQLDLAMAEQLRRLIKDAELKAMQAQINPHFLFNTLNAIHALIRMDPDAARRIIVKLSNYLRMNLTMTQSALVSLSQELRHLKTYLSIMRIRFDDQFSTEIWCESGLESVQIPPSTLQPLVENSIRHGFKDRTGAGIIRLDIRRLGHKIHISIKDNGIGFDDAKIKELGMAPLHSSGSTGLGLHNVNRRLINLFGPDAGLKFMNLHEGGACVEFTIPANTQEGVIKG
jgi:two-component system sensor histidine kinase LytS